MYIGNVLMQNHQRKQHVTVTMVLALATFGGTTQIESFPFETFVSPKGFHLNCLVLQVISRQFCRVSVANVNTA
jgi:hypothetical protein